jgi:hypothetical protein
MLQWPGIVEVVVRMSAATAVLTFARSLGFPLLLDHETVPLVCARSPTVRR